MKFKESFDLALLNKPGIYTFVNPYSYLYLNKEPELYSCFDGIFFDGIAAASIIGFLESRNFQRVSFDYTSIASDVFKYVQCNNKSIAFIGGNQLEIDGFSEFISQTYPELKVELFQNGYFDNGVSKIETLNLLYDLEVDFVICGMGCPAQEQFLTCLKGVGWQGIGFTCGGFFKQTASKSGDYYPKYIDRFNLRFIYRMIDEPKLITRYLIDYPKFLILVVKKKLNIF